ncbi:MAG: hypothetical protein EOO41_01365 [Methanobacteriota archaeon]|nr:MAG: hypothetical protein EOO41_01365 [Euryarchaeota archaeon]
MKVNNIPYETTYVMPTGMLSSMCPSPTRMHARMHAAAAAVGEEHANVPLPVCTCGISAFICNAPSLNMQEGGADGHLQQVWRDW